jgi:hypothetical protein
MSRPKLLLLSLFLLALVASLSTASADGGSAGAAGLPAVVAAQPATGCQAAFDFASLNSSPAPQVSSPDTVPAPEFMARKGYCHCGCGPATCHTSADCGGASCDPFPSCC